MNKARNLLASLSTPSNFHLTNAKTKKHCFLSLKTFISQLRTPERKRTTRRRKTRRERL